MSDPLNAQRHRPQEGGPSFSLGNRIERFSFRIAWWLLAGIVPPPLGWRWRRVLLRSFGAKIAGGAKVYPSARVWMPRNLVMERNATLGPGVECYNMATITLADGAIVSQRAFLCAGDHDHTDPDFQLVTRPIMLHAGSWVAAEAFVGPGVTLGPGAILAARGVASKDLPAHTIWGGNPACQIGERKQRQRV